ncbi:MAG TPA: ZIP family metal transporter [Longimicrobiaceae bacterium]|nr:ZIP family metal transporter [Longimicrobiaceae bacterium]
MARAVDISPAARDFASLVAHDSPHAPVPVNSALLYALAAAGANLVGGLVITTASPRGRVTQRLLVGFGAGFMLAVAILAMVPTAVTATPDGALGILGGYLLVHLTQHVFTPHFHFGEETHSKEMVGRWVGITAVLGLLLHTFFDGVAIASGFEVSAALGVLIFTAILLHKIPEGVTIASIMLASGNSRTRAIGGVLALGVSTILGVLLTAYVGPLATHGLALSAGVTIYVAASNLIPEVQREHGIRFALSVFVGVALYYATESLLSSLHL